jgi:hypothetical protein
MADAADRYTKIVLTVVAVALVTIAVQNLLPTAQAQAPACGSAPQVPCWVANSPKEPLFVSAPRGFRFMFRISRSNQSSWRSSAKDSAELWGQLFQNPALRMTLVHRADV